MGDEKLDSVVKWFNSKKGYGFIEGPNGEDVFAHFSFIVMEGYKTLNKGQKVRYKLETTDRGPQAHDIEPVLDSTL